MMTSHGPLALSKGGATPIGWSCRLGRLMRRAVEVVHAETFSPVWWVPRQACRGSGVHRGPHAETVPVSPRWRDRRCMPKRSLHAPSGQCRWGRGLPLRGRSIGERWNRFCSRFLLLLGPHHATRCRGSQQMRTGVDRLFAGSDSS
jgi:hypothetical protein